MPFAEQNKWVILEVNEVDEQVELFFAPEKLELPAGWVGNIIWYVFTPGWELSTEDGVVFPPDSGFDGLPQPDATRAGCWSTAASNNATGTFHYSVAVHHVTDPAKKVSRVDPVVENDPPVPGNLQKRRPARRRNGALRQNAS
jgi:hypothetical protein